MPSCNLHKVARSRVRCFARVAYKIKRQFHLYHLYTGDHFLFLFRAAIAPLRSIFLANFRVREHSRVLSSIRCHSKIRSYICKLFRPPIIRGGQKKFSTPHEKLLFAKNNVLAVWRQIDDEFSTICRQCSVICARNLLFCQQRILLTQFDSALREVNRMTTALSFKNAETTDPARFPAVRLSSHSIIRYCWISSNKLLTESAADTAQNLRLHVWLFARFPVLLPDAKCLLAVTV